MDMTSNSGNQSDGEDNENQEVENITDPDIDLSLLQEEEQIEESDRSNDEAEAIKLLNDDDEAFESFLEGDETSNDMIHENPIKEDVPNDSENSDLQESSTGQTNDTLNNETLYDTTEGNEMDDLFVENETYFENEEEEIDDEMEGDED